MGKIKKLRNSELHLLYFKTRPLYTRYMKTALINTMLKWKENSFLFSKLQHGSNRDEDFKITK